MDFIITFFRDILDGPVYIVVTVICSILICACIGYLAEKSQKKKKEKNQYVQVESVAASIDSTVPTPTPAVSTVPVAPQVIATPTPVAPPSSAPAVGINSSSGTAESNLNQAPSAPVHIDMPAVVPIPADSSGTALPGGVQASVAPTAPNVAPVTSAAGTISTPQPVSTVPPATSSSAGSSSVNQQ